MKRALCIFVSLVFIVFSMSVVVQAADSYLEYDGFTFDINENGEATIHDYDGRNADVTIPSKLLRAPVVYIDDYTFYNQSLTSVDFQQATGLISIGSCAFYGCTGFTSLTLPSNIEKLSFGAFEYCTGIKDLVLECMVTEIPAQCFYSCSSIDEVVIPESVTSINEWAFAKCTSLAKAVIPKSVEYIAVNAFDQCDKLVIYCYENSYAHQYAIDNDIPYVLLDVEPTCVYLLGDADGDNEITISDVTMIQRFLAKMPVVNEDMIQKSGNVSGGGFDISDATWIQRWLVKTEVPYRINEWIYEYD